MNKFSVVLSIVCAIVFSGSVSAATFSDTIQGHSDIPSFVSLFAAAPQCRNGVCQVPARKQQAKSDPQYMSRPARTPVRRGLRVLRRLRVFGRCR